MNVFIKIISIIALFILIRKTLIQIIIKKVKKILKL